MNELYMELTLLLGLDYLQENFSIPYNDEALTEVLVSTSCRFFSKTRKLIRKLLKIIDSQYISKNLQLSPSFLLLLKKKSKKSGFCLVCDKYFEKLKDHFTGFHKLTYNFFLNYKSSFSHQTGCFFPSVIQRQERPPVEKEVYIIESDQEQIEIENDSQCVSKNVATNKPSVNPFLYYLAEKYVDTIAEKEFFKEKEHVQKVVNVKKRVSSQMVKRASGVCEICKVPVDGKDWNLHMLSHNKTELVSCPLCLKVVSKRYVNKHKRRCSKKSSVGPIDESLIRSASNADESLPIEPANYAKKTGKKAGSNGSRSQDVYKKDKVKKSNLFKKAEGYADRSFQVLSESGSETEDNVLVQPAQVYQEIDVCEICNASIPDGEWRKHMWIHVKKDSTQCPLCDKIFDQRKYLSKHFYRHYKKIQAENALIG